MDKTYFNFQTIIGLVLILLLAVGGFVLMNKQSSQPVVQSIAAIQASEIEPAVSLEEQFVIVDIKGAVNNPGVYELSYGARVEDAIQAAGGIAETADLDRFSLSRASRLSDEQLIIVPVKGDPVLETSRPVSPNQVDTSPGCISINQSSAAELIKLTGIGEARSKKIIENRPYSQIAELVSRGVISQSLFDGLKADICL